MVRLSDVEKQLKRIGANFQYWGRAEKRELCHILTDHEQIVAAVNGRYEGGFAMLVATNQRLLLIDKKIWFLTVEDIRYDMIAEVDYSARVMEASVNIMTFNKTLSFFTFNKRHLRPLTRYVQQQVMDLRQHSYSQQQTAPVVVVQKTTETTRIEPSSEAVASPQESPALVAHDVPTARSDDEPGIIESIEFDRPFLPRIRPANPYTKSALMMRRRFSRF